MGHRIFDLGDFALQKGSVLPDAKLGYLTLGELNEAKDNAVLCPTWFTATPADTAQWMTGPERAIDPAKYFVIVPNHFGAAVSSSPSNTPPPFEKGRFPRTTTYDNIAAQHRLVTEEFGIERLRLVSSWSLGAAQTYAWAAMHPDMVAAAAPISGSARTAHYNKVFLAALRRAITSDPRLQRRLLHGQAADPRDQDVRLDLRRLGVLGALLPRGGVPHVRRVRRRGVHRDLLGRLLRQVRRQRPPGADHGVVAQRPRRPPELRRRLRGCPRLHHRPHDHPQREPGPLLPARRQRLRGVPHPQRRVAPDPGRSGATWRRSTRRTRRSSTPP